MSKKSVCGIYAIKNKTNGKQYIGSSKSVYYRWKQQHYPELNKGDHCNNHLQRSWKKYGQDNFEFIVIEECEYDVLSDRESHWIEHYKSWNRKHGYNLVRIIDGRRVMSEETRLKMIELWQKRLPEFYSIGIHKEIVDLFNSGMGKNTIAKQLNTTRNTVYNSLEYHKLHTNDGKGSIIKLTAAAKQTVLALRDEGMSWQEISEQIVVSKTQLDRAMKIRDGKYGTNKINRKTYITVTSEVKEKAKSLRNQGKTWKEIGKLVGVSREALYWCGIANEQPNMVRSKITPSMIQTAIELRNQGNTWKYIGEKLNCSCTAFNRYL